MDSTTQGIFCSLLSGNCEIISVLENLSKFSSYIDLGNTEASLNGQTYLFPGP